MPGPGTAATRTAIMTDPWRFHSFHSSPGLTNSSSVLQAAVFGMPIQFPQILSALRLPGNSRTAFGTWKVPLSLTQWLKSVYK